MLENCRRLRRLCRKHSNNIARHDKTPVKSTLLSRDKHILSRDMKGVTLYCDFYTFRSCITCTFSLTTCLQVCDIRHILLLSSGILYNTCSMKQPDIYYFETINMTSQAQSKFTENTLLRLVFSIQNLTRLLTSFLWFQNSTDQAVS